ncbi:hypothetical protein LOK74_05065 [Brevibacillus humidisoli]|uniref:hypothetical protein n=1 Tax=Brevibacillus humidisoli TaxID=2895522 RepID=UPI001E5E5330|nr:hypothetical protein [Brevibacillus humidisoli]UFJ41876.1 hypothetical protein LOK74_05065 [Brevibacillus humidisoli]
MPDLKNMADLLRERLTNIAHTHGICDFHLFYEETDSLSSNSGRQESSSGLLRIAWRDGSSSIHQIDRHVFSGAELPIAAWRSVRCFPQDPPHVYLADQETTYPHLSLFDEQAAYWVKNNNLPPLPEHFRMHLSLRRQWTVHSRGPQLMAVLTEVELLHSRFGAALSYRSRKYPTEEELTYLQMESEWYRSCPPMDTPLLQLQLDDDDSLDTLLLFSPEAFRTLIHHGLGVHLYSDAPDETDRLIQSVIRWRQSPHVLSIQLDPLQPWSLGSYRFTPAGTPAASVAMTGPAAEGTALKASYNRQSLHWLHHRSESFRQLMQSADDLCLITELQLPEQFSPFAPVMAWAPQAIRYRCGRPVLRGLMPLQLTLAQLLTCRDLLLVHRVGWDGAGVAVPVHVMGDHS